MMNSKSRRRISSSSFIVHRSSLPLLLTFRLLVIQHAMNRAAEEPDFRVRAFVHLEQDTVGARLDDLADLAADRHDLIALLQLAEQVLALLVLLALVAEHQPDEQHAQQEQRPEALKDPKPFGRRLRGWTGSGGRRLCKKRFDPIQA